MTGLVSARAVWALLVVVGSWVGVSEAQAQMLASPTRSTRGGGTTLGGGFALSEVEYEVNASRDADRKVMFGEGGFTVSPQADVIVQLGRTFDSEWNDI